MKTGILRPDLFGERNQLPLGSLAKSFEQSIYVAESWFGLSGCNVAIWGIASTESDSVSRIRYASGPLSVSMDEIQKQIDKAYESSTASFGESDRTRYARICKEFEAVELRSLSLKKDRLEQTLTPVIDDNEIVEQREWEQVRGLAARLKGTFDPWSNAARSVRVVVRTKVGYSDFPARNRVSEAEAQETEQALDQILQIAGFLGLPVREV